MQSACFLLCSQAALKPSAEAHSSTKKSAGMGGHSPETSATAIPLTPNASSSVRGMDVLVLSNRNSRSKLMSCGTSVTQGITKYTLPYTSAPNRQPTCAPQASKCNLALQGSELSPPSIGHATPQLCSDEAIGHMQDRKATAKRRPGWHLYARHNY